MTRLLAVAALTMALSAPCVAATLPDDANPTPPEIIPAKTALRFNVTQQLSSEKSTTGQRFDFVMLDPIVVDGRTVVAAGTTGHGTLLLAGHAGNAGHEGDLTLRLDVIPTVDDRQMIFADQLLRINGKNKKIMSGVLGFVPFAGLGARFIRGQAVVIEPDQPIQTILDRDASTLNALPAPVPLEH